MTERLLFRAGVAVLLLHAVDDAVLHRQPGVDAGRHALAAGLALAIGGAAMAAFPRLRAGARSWLALSLGLLGLVNGAMHVGHVLRDRLDGSDLTGLAATLAALALLGLAAAIPLRHRPPAGARRWRARAIAVPAALAATVVVVPVGMAIVDSHFWREPIGAPPGGYERVAFDASDGVRLRGWFHPSRNGATVLVVHGGGGDRTRAMRHARMLERRGFGVLVYDARGRGESDGTPSGFGWGWSKDADGALDHLLGRDDVDPARIAALGLSSGADALLELSADRPELTRVVSDGAAAMTWEDGERLDPSPLDRAMGWIMFRSIAVLTGEDRPRPLEERVAAMRAPLLLISAGRRAEHDLNVRYARAAGGPVEHWSLPAVSHTGALRVHPDAYERRVARFLDPLTTHPKEHRP